MAGWKICEILGVKPNVPFWIEGDPRVWRITPDNGRVVDRVGRSMYGDTLIRIVNCPEKIFKEFPLNPSDLNTALVLYQTLEISRIRVVHGIITATSDCETYLLRADSITSLPEGYEIRVNSEKQVSVAEVAQ